MESFCFAHETIAVFISIRYRKTSQTPDVKNQCIKRSVQKTAQPKRDSAFERKARIVSCREISASSQNSFFRYNQRIKPSRAQKDIFGTYSTSFWKVSVMLKKEKLFLYVFDITRHLKRRMSRAKVPNVAFKKQRSQNVTLHLNEKHVLFHVERSQQVLKTAFLGTTKESSQAELSSRFFWDVLNVVWESFCFAHETKAVFISIRYRKTSQTQDVKSQSTQRSVREISQPKRDSAFEQETRFVSSGEIWGSSRNRFFSNNQRNKPVVRLWAEVSWGVEDSMY